MDEKSGSRTLCEWLKTFREIEGSVIDCLWRKEKPSGNPYVMSLPKALSEELLLLGYLSSKISRFSMTENIHVEIRSIEEDLWAICRSKCVRTRPGIRFPTGKWVYEPSPSNRSDAFIRHTRLPKVEALKLAMVVAAEEAALAPR